MSIDPSAFSKPRSDEDWTALIGSLQSHVGASTRADDIVAPGPALRLAATLNHDLPGTATGAPLPAGWHCLYCLPDPRLDALDTDGLPLSAEPIPNIPLSRRVFGGASLVFHDPLRFGDEVTCETRLTKLAFKPTRSGPLVIATIEKHYSTVRGPALVETQDIVHLDPREGGSSQPPPFEREAGWSQHVVPSSPLLFRFSALTFNTHRIHYDEPYATDTEGLPALIVQGRLLAVLSLNLVGSIAPDADIASFAFRSGLPVYADGAFDVCAERSEAGFETWVVNGPGQCAQTGTVVLRQARPA